MRKIQVEISLQRFAMIQIAKVIWKKSDIKHALKPLITKALSYRLHGGPPAYYVRLQRTLSSLVLSQIDALILPKILKEDLKFVVGSMGFTLRLWLEQLYLRRINERETMADLEDYMEHIHWTDHGCIDSAATTRSMYKSNLLPIGRATYLELCRNCLEDCIIDYWPNVPRFDKPMDTPGDSILSYYWRCRMKNNMKQLIDDFKGLKNCDIYYDPNCTIHENLFLISFADCNYVAVKFFWTLLRDDQRRNMIINISEKLINGAPLLQWKIHLFVYGNALTVNLLIFYLQQIYNYELEDLWITLMQAGTVVRLFLMWPYQDSFFSILEESMKYRPIQHYRTIFYSIFHSMKKRTVIVGHDVEYHKIFHELWRRNPESMKSLINYHDTIYELVKMKDINLLHFIINDTDLQVNRKGLLQDCVSAFKSIQRDPEFLDDFIEKVLVTDEERAWFAEEASKIIYYKREEDERLVVEEEVEKREWSPRKWWQRLFKI